MKLLNKLLLATSILGCTLGMVQASESEQKIFKLKLAETWGPNTPILGDATRNMAKLAEQLSNGRLQIRVDSANKHKSPFGVFDLVRSGQYDLGHSSSYFWKGKVPNTLYFSSMPFGMMTTEQYAWFYHGGGMELMQSVYEPYNLLSFPGGNSDIQMGGWFKKEINSLDDLKGLKIRIPGFAGEILANVGASPVNIAPGEMYTALERGVIDAAEFAGPAFDLRLGFPKVAPYYYTAWHEPGSESQFLVNKKLWQELPDDLKLILETAFRLIAYDMHTESLHANAHSWQSMSQDFPDVKVRQFPVEVIEALKASNQELLESQAANDELAKKILDSQARYLATTRAWTSISLKAYLDSTAE